MLAERVRQWERGISVVPQRQLPFTSLRLQVAASTRA